MEIQKQLKYVHVNKLNNNECGCSRVIHYVWEWLEASPPHPSQMTDIVHLYYLRVLTKFYDRSELQLSFNHLTILHNFKEHP